MPQPLEYGFNEQLKMSQHSSVEDRIKSILLKIIPDAIGVEKADVSSDKKGTDYWVKMRDGTSLSIDTKVREVDFAANDPEKDDLALETWSVMPFKEEGEEIPGKIGWTRDETKRTDYVLWFWRDTGRHELVPFKPLCKVFQANWVWWSKKLFLACKQFTPSPYYKSGGYYSECIFVPRGMLLYEIRKLRAEDEKHNKIPSQV